MNEQISFNEFPATPSVPVEKLPASNQVNLAREDIVSGFKQWRMWFGLAWQDVRLRYRRSVLGPFWVTISMSVTILGISLLYGFLFKNSLNEYLPFVATGMIAWGFYATVLGEGCQVFIEAEGYLKQIKLSYTGLVIRVVMRNFIIFLHNLVIMLPIIFILHVNTNISILWLIPALLLVLLTAIVYVFIFAIVATRFRDMGQMIVSFIQIIFFITPVMWYTSVIPQEYQMIIKWNPFSGFIELLRMPLLGGVPSMEVWLTALGIFLFGAIGAFILLVKRRSRIIYWL